MFLKPAPGLRIRDPQTRQLLPQTGAEVTPQSYWRRRLRDGDVVLAASPAAAAEATAAATPPAISAAPVAGDHVA